MFGMFEHSGPYCHVPSEWRLMSQKVTIRLPEDSLAQLRQELDNFNTETARFQYLVQLYFDWKELGAVAPNPPEPDAGNQCGSGD